MLLWLCLCAEAYGEAFSTTANMLPGSPPKSQLHSAEHEWYRQSNDDWLPSVPEQERKQQWSSPGMGEGKKLNQTSGLQHEKHNNSTSKSSQQAGCSTYFWHCPICRWSLQKDEWSKAAHGLPTHYPCLTIISHLNCPLVTVTNILSNLHYNASTGKSLQSSRWV